MENTIKLSDHFGTGRLLRFALPSIVMMVFTSIYGVVDGFFVSNYAGKTALAAVNLIFPFVMILSTLGFMFGAGGSALVAKTLGEGDPARANRLFSLFVYASLLSGIVIAALGILVSRPVAALLGATGELLDNCVIYGRILLAALPAFMLQLEFQVFFVTAERPKLGLYFTVGAGVTNMVLDLLLVGVFRWGLVGAALATSLSQVVGGVGPLLYFARKNSSLLRIGKTKLDIPAILRAMGNGSSELMSNVSMSLVSMLYNAQLMAYAGQDGVAAYGVMMYVNFVFISAFIGYTIGLSPIVSYHYGAENRDELKSLCRRSIAIVLTTSAVMLAAALLLARPLSTLFVGYDGGLREMTERGFYLYAASYLFAGFCILISSFFTALNNGLISALISFLRTLGFQVAAVLLLPLWLGLDGIWLSIVVAELMAALVSAILLLLFRKRYGY